MTDRVDVLGIGNAMVDILCFAENSELQKMGLIKGSMTLIDEDAISELESAVKPVSVCSGGSVANSMVQLSLLGGRSQFIGKIARDKIGQQFHEDMNRSGVGFNTRPAESGDSTGRCYIFVTSDAQRTMSTSLGACTMLSAADVEEEAIKRSSFLLIEGYLWDLPGAKDLILESSRVAREAGTSIAFTLSDPFLVDRHRCDLQKYVEQQVDLLFANELEAQSLYISENLEAALEDIKGKVKHLVVTRGEQGSVVVSQGKTHVLKVEPVPDLVDTTGAGDAYAAGFLYGFTRDWLVPKCMDSASGIAAQVIRQVGGRLGTLHQRSG